eukprot:CAMPEP_0114616790 /NCGR_PEP_ID=MMETSP0168-20121206/6867_1 /TAXON_ID=95228 ORGANISM="Vannella sp., Strain DIVA3 517/6/12" /NCGR_SAMPLE_ID=MMETSP0168 /ASSEMBLY_ACC=CAM_ASM_000044 /LENGTH=96 /DNA_ID=CAMNT_0001827913 /DNA_START=21 /DNA_END=311 /DNA_ORIENTATION=+
MPERNKTAGAEGLLELLDLLEHRKSTACESVDELLLTALRAVLLGALLERSKLALAGVAADAQHALDDGLLRDALGCVTERRKLPPARAIGGTLRV